MEIFSAILHATIFWSNIDCLSNFIDTKERTTMTNDYQKVVEANIQLHSRLANEYSQCEPQYRPENVRRLTLDLQRVIAESSATRVLDLGCGTGFLIDIIRPFVSHITGVDVTPAMMEKIDTSGPTSIDLIHGDTGSVSLPNGTYDLVTAHSFLHHLYDITPTIETAYNALRDGGVFYSELDPNYYFWEAICSLQEPSKLTPLLQREYRAVKLKDEEIEDTFGVEKDIFNWAEYGKNIAGGFKEEELVSRLRSVGFSSVSIKYHWFVGQSLLFNSMSLQADEARLYSAAMEEILMQSLPLSRHLFKYVGFEAIK